MTQEARSPAAILSYGWRMKMVGAHVGESVRETYADLSRTGLVTFQPGEGEEDRRFRNLVAPSVRQIAFEVERTLEKNLSEEEDLIQITAPICPLPIATKIHVGRNDPCPCGGGKKFKRCFGLRRPRRQLSIDQLKSEVH